MARVNLEINFGDLGQLATKSNEYYSSIEDLLNAIKEFENAIENNSGKAAEQLKKDTPELNSEIIKLADGLQSASKLLLDYESEMTGIIAPNNREMMMHVSINKAKNTLKDLYSVLEALNDKNMYTQLPDLPSVVEGSVDGDIMSELENGRAILKTYNAFLEEYKIVTSELFSTHSESINSIIAKLDEFKNLDEEYENIAESAFDTYAQYKWYQTTVGKITIGAAVVVAALAIIAFAPYAGAAALALGATASTAGTIGTIAGGAAVVAKGAIIGAITTSSIDVTKAIFSKEDLDSTFADSFAAGIVGGAITAGIGLGAGVVSNGNRYVAAGVDALGDAAGEIAEDYLKGDEVNPIMSTIKSIGTSGLKVGASDAMQKILDYKEYLDINELEPENWIQKGIVKASDLLEIGFSKMKK